MIQKEKVQTDKAKKPAVVDDDDNATENEYDIGNLFDEGVEEDYGDEIVDLYYESDDELNLPSNVNMTLYKAL